MAEVGKTLNPDGPEGGGVEIDPVTGQPTTGHVWDGIRELNRPLPRWWLWTFYATIIFSLVYVVLYPAVPLLRGGTGGVLGYSTRADVEDQIDLARQAQAGRLDQIAEPAAGGDQGERRPRPLRRRRRPLGLPGQLHPVPRHRRGRLEGLCQPQRRRLAVGRHARRHLPAPSPTASVRTTPTRATRR